MSSMLLRDFQVEAIRRGRQGNLYLAAKPGSGKTAVAVHLATGKTLVVTPKRVVPQFEIEARKWGLNLTFAHCLGKEDARKAALAADADVIVVSHDHFPWLVKNVPLKSWQFDLVVFDEASRLRNGGRQGAVGWKVMNEIRKKTRSKFLLMSGSPRPGTAHELFAPVFLLDGGARLGNTLGGFRAEYLEPAKVDRQTGQVFSWRLRDGKEAQLYSKIRDLFYAVSPDLGLKYAEIDRWVTLPGSVASQCQKMARFMTADFFEDEITAGSLGVVAGKLLQMCSGEVFNDSGSTTVIHDEKIQELRAIIEELDGEPLMVGYWYTHERDRLMRQFPEAVDITTDSGLAAAKAGKVSIALIHPQSAGHGIDGLQQHFSALAFYTCPHSYEYYDQLIKRIVRNGQTETVRVFRIVASNGVADVRVLEALSRKEQEQEAFYGFLNT
jgi:hypothetical protein